MGTKISIPAAAKFLGKGEEKSWEQTVKVKLWKRHSLPHMIQMDSAYEREKAI